MKVILALTFCTVFFCLPVLGQKKLRASSFTLGVEQGLSIPTLGLRVYNLESVQVDRRWAPASLTASISRSISPGVMFSVGARISQLNNTSYTRNLGEFEEDLYVFENYRCKNDLIAFQMGFKIFPKHKPLGFYFEPYFHLNILNTSLYTSYDLGNEVSMLHNNLPPVLYTNKIAGFGLSMGKLKYISKHLKIEYGIQGRLFFTTTTYPLPQDKIYSYYNYYEEFAGQVYNNESARVHTQMGLLRKQSAISLFLKIGLQHIKL